MHSFSKISRVEQGLRASFSKVRDELDDHLDTINRNSEEIHSLYEFLAGLEQKIDKLAERIDELQSGARHHLFPSFTLQEQEVFLALYAAEEPLSTRSIAQELGLSEKLVATLLSNLMVKGVPVLRQSVHGDLSYALELRFKELQARENVLRIDACVTRSFSRKPVEENI